MGDHISSHFNHRFRSIAKVSTEGAMYLKVGPAKRQGSEKTILEQSLHELEVRGDGDDVELIFCASGIYDNSQYRYRMRFSRSQMIALLERGPGLSSRPASHQPAV
ncbi:hypothetical protein [Mesorhizobium sp. 8]|nr:hypothetical protein [Mesorhizobium sp. 8]QDC00393.1 hypothetical protein FGU64_08170 [Mesorhizobium sp. 8]